MMYKHFMQIGAILYLAVFATIGQFARAENINYCHDKETNLQWEKLAQKNSEPEFKELYALRKELCRQVDDGNISLDSAIDKFESEREKKIKILRERKERIEKENQSSISG